MKYKITTLFRSDYCQLKPSDPTCHRNQIVEANSKVEAVLELHKATEYILEPLRKVTLPEVWSVEQL